MTEKKKANDNSHNKEKRLEEFCLVGGIFLFAVVYGESRLVMGLGILPSMVLGVCALGVGSIMGLGIYKLGKKIGKMRVFKGSKAILAEEIYLSKKICLDCPQCGHLLKGAIQEMTGDTGVCPKCKSEFVIEQKQ